MANKCYYSPKEYIIHILTFWNICQFKKIKTNFLYSSLQIFCRDNQMPNKTIFILKKS